MRVLSSVLFLFISYFLYSQITTQEALAKQYMSNGEYEKARVILEELYKDGHKEAYNDYLLCLIEIGEYKALKVSKSMYKPLKMRGI
jgi:FimV-like protein